jgi:LacI family transcriptional regulator
VALNNRGTGCDRWIILDDQLGTRLAVNHLRQLGHTRIGYIAGPSGSDTASRRLEGYRSAMEELDLAVGAELIEAGGYQADAGAVAAQRLLDRDGPRPTAIVVANLVSAAGVLASVKGQGLSVPTDVSIVAIHDLPLAALLDPPLTTISMPLAALGRRGVARLLEPEEGPIRETISDEVVLVVRGSTTALT